MLKKQQKTKSHQRGPVTVVVLCAEEEVRDLVTYWFSELPVKTVVAANGYEANRILKKVESGLLVTDRVLPPWPGLDTFIDLRFEKPGVRIAYVDDGSLNSQILASVTGAEVILTRPLTRKAVIGALGRGAPMLRAG